jgi:hypothetical protein
MRAGSEVEAAQNRVFEAMLFVRPARLTRSLVSAEHAYERLCIQDYMDFRRLAALEVASSMLALGDVAAAALERSRSSQRALARTIIMPSERNGSG